MSVTPALRAHAQLRPLDAEQARWARGFWGTVHDRTRDVTVPRIWDSLSDPEISPGLRNFRLAAGLESGTHVGPPFMDGDFYKWFEAATARLETDPDDELADRLQRIAELIASVQRADGYLHTPTVIAERNDEDVVALADRFNFETYNLGHLITAGVRHWQVTGSETLLDAAKKAASFLETLATQKPLELARSAICPSHYMAVIELYRATDDERYLRLAETFVRVRDAFDEGGDDNQDRIAVRDQTVVAGHAVRANYLYAGLADLVAETGDEELTGVLERLWHDVVDTKLYITGGCGALYDGASPDGDPWQSEISRVHQAYGRAFQLPHTTAHAESCANIGMIFWSERMLALTGDAKYTDVIEQIAYNSLLGSVSLAGSEYFYTNALRQVRDLPYDLRRPGDTGQAVVPPPPPSDERLRERYLSCFCCPPNIARTLASFHQRAASLSDDGLFVHLYGGSDIDVADDAGRLALREDSDYPWHETVTFTVAAASGALPLHLRIPGWCSGAVATVNGTPVPVSGAGTYTRIQREWAAGDVVELTLPMPVRVLRGHRLAEELTNQVAVQRGPVVYALESADLPDGVLLEQVALRRGGTFAPVEIEIDGARLTALETEVTILPLDADAGLYGDLEQAPLRSLPARLVPYFAWGNRGPGEMSVWLPLVW
ncbi:glycoside hydrolase family 127 protein [Microbacterium oleivorans]|uniref:Glycoside hydrolase family 127 protein n=1 Tax=Microbacterium oleivorans TaxID=273677 RepID=A0A7D5JEY6_9MICO|nr:beta-L-arabinofuranosidase domain-containing protein [Microbacterium oleivorans]QLD11458.1 glycoside hydrolase family 127 protein [Microbacterium oleivorans]